MANELRTILDMGKETYVALKCKQNDDRTLILTLLSNGVAWIPDVGSVLELRGKRANNTISIQTATDITIVDNIVTITLDRDFTRVPGNVDLELAIRGIDIDLTTFTFRLNVIASVVQDGLDVSNNTSNLLEELTNITDWGNMYITNAIDNVVNLTKKHGQYSVGLASGTRVVLPTVAEDEYVDIDYMFYADSDLILVFDDNIKWSNQPLIQSGRSYRFSFRYVNGVWFAEWVKLERYLKDYIYKAGDTCGGLTGGYTYVSRQWDWSGSDWSGAIYPNIGGKISLSSQMSSRYNYDQTATTINSIDLTDYKYIYIDLEIIGSAGIGGDIYSQVLIGSTVVYSSISLTRQIIKIDISGFNSSNKISYKTHSYYNPHMVTLNIYNAWLEKNEFVDTSQEIFTESEKNKLKSISASANKVIDSTINGNILIDGVETNVYYIQSGTTAQRPIPTRIGQAYFDTDLGKPIWCKTVETPVWVDGIGTTV